MWKNLISGTYTHAHHTQSPNLHTQFHNASGLIEELSGLLNIYTNLWNTMGMFTQGLSGGLCKTEACWAHEKNVDNALTEERKAFVKDGARLFCLEA